MASCSMHIRILLALLMLTALSACRPYILPVPDGGGLTPSPPSLIGTLVAVSSQTISVNSDNPPAAFGNPVLLGLTPQTAIFTEDGGFLTPGDLRVGLTVRVWFATRRGTPRSCPRAGAVVVVPSEHLPLSVRQPQPGEGE